MGEAGAETRQEPRTGDEIVSPYSGVEFPVSSLRAAAIHLRRPFTPEAVKWKVQSNFGEKGCLVVGYIDARLVIERLNLLLADLWCDRYTQLDQNFVECQLTVDGVTRPDVGQGAGKAGRSDSLKRAAVKFGVGVSLYAIPRAEMWLNQHGKYIEMRKTRGKDGKDKIIFTLTAAGEAALRVRYAKWLEEVGIPNFGEPLDHGDVVDAVGDADVPGSEPEEPEEAPAVLVEGPEADRLRTIAREFYGELTELVGRAAYPPAQFQAGLAAHGDSLERLDEFASGLKGRLGEARRLHEREGAAA